MWRKFFSLFPYLRFFQYVIKVNSCCLFFLISRAFLMTMPFSLIWIPNMKIWRILKVIWLHAIIQINAFSVTLEWKQNTTAVNFEFIRRAWHKTGATKSNITQSLHFTQSTSPHYFIKRNFEDILSWSFLDNKIYLRVSVHEV